MKIMLTALLALFSSAARANFPSCLEVSPYPLSPTEFREGAIIQGAIPFRLSEDGQIADRSNLVSYDDRNPNRIVVKFRRVLTAWGLGEADFLSTLTIEREAGRPVRLVIQEDRDSLQFAYCGIDAAGRRRGEFVRDNGDSRNYRKREQIDIQYERDGRTCRAMIREAEYAPVYDRGNPEPCAAI